MSGEQTPYQTEALDELQVMLAMQGDRQAFSLLYRRWHPRLLRYARRLTGDPEDARDVMQETAMAIARNLHRLQHPGKFGPWAYTIVRNRSANYIKRIERDRKLKTAIRSEIDTAPVQIGSNVPADRLRDLIATLPDAARDVLTAFYVDGMSLNEIAACFAVPSGTIKSRLFTARTHLKTAYEEKEGDHHD